MDKINSIIRLDPDNSIGIVATNSTHYIQLVFSHLLEGKIIVPLRREVDVERIQATNIKKIISPDDSKGWFAPIYNPTDSDSVALISFTSGTEGEPKGVILSHRALNDVIQRMIEVSEINNSACEYIGVPVYHSFGFGRCRLLGTIRGKAYIPENGFNPSEIALMLRKKEINSLSAVPSLLRILLSQSNLFGEEERNALKWVEIGSQPMSLEEKTAFSRLFPKANIMQHYGLTEASRTSLLRIDKVSPAFMNSVGKAYGNTEIKTNALGKILIRGPHLASALLIQGKIQPLTNADGWLATTDIGHMEGEYLFFEGRADNTINCGGQKISAEKIEQDIYQQFNISNGIAISRIPNPIYGECVLLIKDNSCDIKDEILFNHTLSILNKNGISASNALEFRQIDKIPITETGKIRRKKLADMFISDKDINIHKNDSKTNDTKLEQLLSIFQQVTGKFRKVQIDDSIETLALDSIVVVSLSMSIEKMFGKIPKNFRTLTIRELSILGTSDGSFISSHEPKLLSRNNTKGTTNENPKDLNFIQLIKEDFETHDRNLFSYGFWAIFNNRFGNWRMGIKPKLLRAPFSFIYKIQLKCIHILCGIKLDYTVKLGRRIKIEHFGGMILGAKKIGDDVTIRQNTTLGVKNLSELSGKPTIEQGVNIGAGAVIVGDIRIGRYSVIGPNAVVEQDIPPFSFVSAPKSEIMSFES